MYIPVYTYILVYVYQVICVLRGKDKNMLKWYKRKWNGDEFGEMNDIHDYIIRDFPESENHYQNI